MINNISKYRKSINMTQEELIIEVKKIISR
jgi:hypothetical protein